MTQPMRFTRVPDPVLHAAEVDASLRCRFEIEAEGDDPAASLSCDVYVKGTLRRNGVDQAWVLDEEPPVLLVQEHLQLLNLDATDVRNLPRNDGEEAARGHSFSGQAEVFLIGQPGDRLEMDLSFVARLIDPESDPPALVDERSWVVSGIAFISPSGSTGSPDAEAQSDALYAHVWRGARDDPWSGKILVVRSGSPGVAEPVLPGIAIDDLSAIGTNATRRVMQRGSTIAGSARSWTWTLMFDFDDLDAPHALTGRLNNKAFTLPLATAAS